MEGLVDGTDRIKRKDLYFDHFCFSCFFSSRTSVLCALSNKECAIESLCTLSQDDKDMRILH